MNALSLHAVGDLRYIDVPMPSVKNDEVLVKIKCAGICGSDISRVFGNGAYHFPIILGHEFSGQVVEDKSGEWLNKNVAVYPLLPCFKCDMCKKGNYAECSSYDYYGSRRDGGYAEYIAVKKFNLIELPNNITYKEGAMCEPTAVAIHALNKLNLVKGQSLLISGAGTIGIIIAQLALSRGASKVCFIEIDKNKQDFCKNLGFSLYNEEEKFDVAIEGTGVGSALETLLGGIKPFGKAVLMGNPLREMTLSQKGYWHILRKELSLFGIWNNCFNENENDWKDAIKAISDKQVDLKPLITHVFSLEEGLKGLSLMRDKKEFYCKVMINVER